MTVCTGWIEVLPKLPAFTPRPFKLIFLRSGHPPSGGFSLHLMHRGPGPPSLRIILDLIVCLSLHAREYDAEEEVCNVLNAICSSLITETTSKNCNDLADVAEADDVGVARIGLNLESLHDKQTIGRGS
eukprot:CAMPEP_0114496994 /NCGR_PEP_ID=MMETSP0109-20121206/6072_1 /TAXON_ID=29199 /ORGANISM="Chlorarachnion reptans, Strain CCCM449" /LENGTH=128 /DNA_ID=CAMNT_0001674315 /DNA_START=176 /DNA_END=562 /DNA_ORIENTATION=-